jgi:hypothetical protein
MSDPGGSATKGSGTADHWRHDEAAAKAVRKAVVKAGGLSNWRVTELLNHFSLYHLTPDVRDRIQRALDHVEVECDPGLTEAVATNGALSADRYKANRFYAVRLSTLENTREASASNSIAVYDVGHGTISEAGLDELGQTGPVWVDVDASAADRNELLGVVGQLVRRSTANAEAGRIAGEIVQEVLRADFRPHPDVYDDLASILSVSAFAVACEEATVGDPGDERRSKAGALTFRLVEFASGPDWLITVRHPGERFAGSGRIGVEDSLPEGRCAGIERAALLAAGRRRWARATRRRDQTPEQPALTASDLGILLLHEVADTSRRVIRVLEAWLDQWELVAERDPVRLERATPTAVRALSDELRARLRFFQDARRENPTEAWFPDVQDDAEADHVFGVFRRDLDELDGLAQRLRTAFEVLQARQGDRLRRHIEIVTFIFLVPALITGVFGANTNVPGENEWWGFELMFGAMVALTTVLWILLWRPRWLRRVWDALPRTSSD